MALFHVLIFRTVFVRKSSNQILLFLQTTTQHSNKFVFQNTIWVPNKRRIHIHFHHNTNKFVTYVFVSKMSLIECVPTWQLDNSLVWSSTSIQQDQIRCKGNEKCRSLLSLVDHVTLVLFSNQYNISLVDNPRNSTSFSVLLIVT